MVWRSFVMRHAFLTRGRRRPATGARILRGGRAPAAAVAAPRRPGDGGEHVALGDGARRAQAAAWAGSTALSRRAAPPPAGILVARLGPWARCRSPASGPRVASRPSARAAGFSGVSSAFLSGEPLAVAALGPDRAQQPHGLHRRAFGLRDSAMTPGGPARSLEGDLVCLDSTSGSVPPSRPRRLLNQAGRSSASLTGFARGGLRGSLWPRSGRFSRTERKGGLARRGGAAERKGLRSSGVRPRRGRPGAGGGASDIRPLRSRPEAGPGVGRGRDTFEPAWRSTLQVGLDEGPGAHVLGFLLAPDHRPRS